MSELEQLMDANSNVQSVRTLYAAYKAILYEIRAQAHWVRQMGAVGEHEHEASCLESLARSAEQNFARQMREAVKREFPKPSDAARQEAVARELMAMLAYDHSDDPENESESIGAILSVLATERSIERERVKREAPPVPTDITPEQLADLRALCDHTADTADVGQTAERAEQDQRQAAAGFALIAAYERMRVAT